MIENKMAKELLLGHTCDECEDYRFDSNNKPSCCQYDRSGQYTNGRAPIPENMTCIFWRESIHKGFGTYES